MKSAVLKRPDGVAIAAARIDRDRNTYSEDTGYGPNLGARVVGGSSGGVSSGVGFGFPLFGGGGPSGAQTHSMTTSTVRFQVPDMAAYRRDWQHWVLHIDLDDGANSRTIETLPPAAAPGLRTSGLVTTGFPPYHSGRELKGCHEPAGPELFHHADAVAAGRLVLRSCGL